MRALRAKTWRSSRTSATARSRRLQAGDRDRHDELVRDGVRTLVGEVDAIVLAQASMARVVDTMADDERPVPVLSSPRLGVKRAAELLATLRREGSPAPRSSPT